MNFLKVYMNTIKELFWLSILVLVISLFGRSCNSEAKELVVAIVDTGIDLGNKELTKKMCKTGHMDYTGEGLQDQHGHGSHIAGLIINYAEDSKYCLVIIKFASRQRKEYHSNFVKAMSYISVIKPDIVNISAGGTSSSLKEFIDIQSNQNIIYVAAAGNDSRDITLQGSGFYPASYGLKNIIVVGAKDANGYRHTTSNYGNMVDKWELGVDVESWGLKGNRVRMTGTSQATAIHTGKLVFKRGRK